MTKMYKCELCNRDISEVTKHHLIPKQKGGRDLHIAYLCTTCHKQIHALYTNTELSSRLFTIDRLKNDEKIIKYLNFIKNHPNNLNIKIKKSKNARLKK